MKLCLTSLISDSEEKHRGLEKDANKRSLSAPWKSCDMIEGAECYSFWPKWHTYSPTSHNKQEYAHTSATQNIVAGVMSCIGLAKSMTNYSY